MKNRKAKQTKHMIKNLQPKHLTASVKDYNSTIKGTIIVLRDQYIYRVSAIINYRKLEIKRDLNNSTT